MTPHRTVRIRTHLLAGLLVLFTEVAGAQERTLRLLTLPLFAPVDVVEAFTRETGIRVDVTEVEGDQLIERLRDQPAAFDLVQPAQDRVAAAQAAHNLFRPLDFSRVDVARLQPAMLEATRLNTRVNGLVYALPHLWGTDGLVLGEGLGPAARLETLCADPAARIGVPHSRRTLIAFAFDAAQDPFAAYQDPKAYATLMAQVSQRVQACSAQLRWQPDTAQLAAGLTRRELVAGLMSDGAGWRLARTQPTLQFTVPAGGAAGWIVGYALPAKGRSDGAAYAWINHNLRPEVAGRVASSAGHFSAVRGAELSMEPALRRQFAQSYPEDALGRIRWYPPLPAEIEAIDARQLARLRGAR